MAQKTDSPAKRARQDDVLNAPALAILWSLECKGLYVIFSEQEDKPRADLNHAYPV
jgi:hypothetical protein